MARLRSILNRLFGIFLLRGVSSVAAKVREINQRYGTPRVKMTPLVKASLFLLRVYLLFLVAILVFKFWTLIQ
ncbi:MAG: hypothetical protein V1798_12190 [Pseudomonadota bacterium]